MPADVSGGKNIGVNQRNEANSSLGEMVYYGTTQRSRSKDQDALTLAFRHFRMLVPANGPGRVKSRDIEGQWVLLGRIGLLAATEIHYCGGPAR